MVKRDRVGTGREVVKLRQCLRAKPRLHIGAHGRLVRYLRQHGSPVKKYSVQNFLVESRWANEIREDAVRLPVPADE
jgi:hypothetical protein